MHNAVAPDWNLKFLFSDSDCILQSNAVAPDWNLKNTPSGFSVRFADNAVAPDWNLKQYCCVRRESNPY